MIDTMTATKVVGALCGSLLIFLLGGWLAESLYHVGGHGEGEQAYIIPVEDDAAPEEEIEEVAFADVYAEADPAAGESIWRQCSSCHRLEDGANGTGPHLYAIVGREQASVDGYAYSSAFAELAAAWTPEELNGFLENPSEWVPGTKMTYRGLADVEDRAAIIAYMEGFGS
jgi:cytochrome c